ncbi:MAG: thiamine pyrophosphate-binding protein [Candidatus Nanopelagicales bacterium]
MTSQRTVGTAILELLADRGVEVAFGLPGVHNLAFWSADSPVRIVGVRHEQACAYAADGYARATGRLGVALTTTGPGAANALAAFGEAAVSGAPVLLISSDVSTALRSPDGPRGILHEMRDQAAPFASLGRPARTGAAADEALAAVSEAVDMAMSAPRGPVYVGIPSDILNAAWLQGGGSADPPGNSRDVPSSRATAAHAVPAPSASVTAALAAELGSARRPLIWSGGGVTQSGPEGERVVRALAQRLGAPVVTTYAGRGVMAGDPLVIETSTHEPEVESLIGDADLLIVVGSGFDAMHTKNWKMSLPGRRVAISMGEEIGRTIGWDLLVSADLVATIDSLLETLPADPRAPWAPTDLRERVRARLQADERTAPAIDFVDAVDTWPEHGAIVTDMCIPGYWFSSHGRQPRPRRLLNPVGWGTLGYALPAAIGPAASGAPTLAVCGDGGPMFALGELAAVVQEGLPVTLLVVDDGGYGMLRYDQQVLGHPERGVDLVTPDWEQLAASFGIDFTEVDDAASLRAALGEAAARPGPSFILMRTLLYPPASTSPRWFEVATGPRETA